MNPARAANLLQTYREVIAMRSIPRLLLAIVVLTILFIGAPAQAEVETFPPQSASYDTYIQPVWSSGTSTVTLEPWIAPDVSGIGYHLTGSFDFYFRCGSSSVNPEQCTVAGNFSPPYDGTLVVQRNYAGPGRPRSNSTSLGEDTATVG
jgi:hypothetical protein